jgi:hypothetical protein
MVLSHRSMLRVAGDGYLLASHTRSVISALASMQGGSRISDAIVLAKTVVEVLYAMSTFSVDKKAVRAAMNTAVNVLGDVTSSQKNGTTSSTVMRSKSAAARLTTGPDATMDVTLTSGSDVSAMESSYDNATALTEVVVGYIGLLLQDAKQKVAVTLDTTEVLCV